MVGKGDKINLWNDNWLGEPHCEIFEIPCANRKILSTKAEDLIEDHRWSILNFITLNYPETVGRINQMQIPRGNFQIN